jgi:signal transduction histidine kinase
MDKLILLHTHSIMAFILATTQLGMLFFLLRLPNHTQIRRWMIINYLSSVIWQADQIVRFSLNPSVQGTLLYKLETVFVYSPALAVLVLSYFQILYLFLYQPYEKERRIMMRIVVPVAFGLVAFNAWNEFANHSNIFIFQATSFVYGFLTNIWALVISIRKSRLLRTVDRQAARALGTLVLVNIGFIVMCVVDVAFGFYSPVGYWTFFILIWLCNLTQIVVYITYSAVPVSFQIKIAGFSFVTVVTFLTVVTLAFFPPLIPTDIPARLQQQTGLRRMFIIIAGASVFVVAVLPGLLRISLTDPLKRLLLGVKEVNGGNLMVQVAVGSPDEIGDLTVNFNQMTHSLKQANDELRNYAEKLELKVEERTAALRQSLVTLQNTQTQLIQSEKMASLGELTAGIAHEIQNPLNFVNNFSEVSAEMMNELKECLETGQQADAIVLADELAGNLVKIAHHGGRAAGIVKNMLEHSKPSNGLRNPADINALCLQYAQLSFNIMLAKNQSFICSLRMDLDPDTGNIDLISQDIGRVLQNVFNNAFYAVHEKRNQQNGTATVYEPQVFVNTYPLLRPDGSREGIEIRIRDNGTGMPEGVKAKIFQPFFTTKPTGQGTGLGLSISYDIVTKGHGGSFLVESRVGEGTEMIIRLPGNNSSQNVLAITS